MVKSAVEIVRAYGIDAWNGGHDEWIPQLCADPIIRHDANREVRLSHAEQRARMRHNYEELRPTFEPVVLAGDDEYVTLIWNVTGRDPNWKLCGIEIFRVLDGKIVEVWNSPYLDGRWGLSKSLGACRDGTDILALALVEASVALENGRAAGRLLVPAETRGAAHWLERMFGRPVSERVDGKWLHRFAPRTNGAMPPHPSLVLADSAGPAIGLENVEVSGISIELERSGLVNMSVELQADQAPPRAPGPFPAPTPVRPAETTGQFERGGLNAAVAAASVTLLPSGAATGSVSLRVDEAAMAVGEGKLSFGWRERGEAVIFEGIATLSAPTSFFSDGTSLQATYNWSSDGLHAEVVSDHGADASGL